MPYLICVSRLDLSNDCDEGGRETGMERRGEGRGRESEKTLNSMIAF